MNRLALSAPLALQMLHQARRRAHHGPGVPNRLRGYGKYTGEVLRQIRAERGVGRPLGTVAVGNTPDMEGFQ